MGEQTGLYSKYYVFKIDAYLHYGNALPGCFVLRPEKDRAARAAILTYARETLDPALAASLRALVESLDEADSPKIPTPKRSG